MKALWARAKSILKSICMVDRFLMLFMLVLFAYMGYHLLTGGTTDEGVNTVNIIVRTSAAAIFGYFISSNFDKSHSLIGTNSAGDQAQTPVSASMLSGSNDYMTNPMALQAPSIGWDGASPNISESEKKLAPTGHYHKIQMVVVSIVGLFSLVILLIAQNHVKATPELTAIVSQFRDFVSVCIGFLISCGKSSD